MPPGSTETFFNPFTCGSEGKFFLLRILERDLRRKERQHRKAERAAKATLKAAEDAKADTAAKPSRPRKKASASATRPQEPKARQRRGD